NGKRFPIAYSWRWTGPDPSRGEQPAHPRCSSLFTCSHLCGERWHDDFRPPSSPDGRRADSRRSRVRKTRNRMLAVTAAGVLCLPALPVPAAALEGLGGAVHYASDLDWVSADNGWGPVERDFNNGARAVPDNDRAIQSIRGTKYPKGLGTHAP